MTAHLIPVYGASIATISMLAIFAWHNRINGWKKPSRPVESDAVDAPDSADIAQPSWNPMTCAETAYFSAQLLNLKNALGTTEGVPVLNAVPQHR